ncbi:UPF0481 protein At3g47200-like [Macadamia integrifolia]|uniref:UPF0481 protein At3g47200-like n=1 Tax=Macadamia integrifolia TaxID=60698 RepID=UPI001C52B659|nr:UPF0481 protein At3g47200-like [Macadamia integrifolia]
MNGLELIHSMGTGASSSSDSTIDKKKKGLHHEDHQLNNDEIEMLVESMKEKLEEVTSLHSNYDIYRVPMQLCKVKPEAYTPQSVSIGPLHYNEEHLRTMETHKLRYLNCLLDRPSAKTLDVYVKAVSNLEETARKCYSETIMGFGKDEFVKMMVVDGCFILEFLKIITLRENDHFRSNYSWYWEIKTDLIKLENQLPFFVLEHLHSLTFDPHELLPQYNTFSHYIYVNLLKWYAQGLHGPTIDSDEQIKSLQLPEGGAKHFLHLLGCVLIPSSPARTEQGEKYLRLTSCATELRSAGIKFRKKEKSDSPKTSLFDVAFDTNKGILTIPTIIIFDETELILRNLIAFEQGKQSTAYFTAYAAFMDDLIDTVRDVELLEQKGIITNILGSPKDVVTLFNNITKQVVLVEPYYSGVIKDLEDYHNKSWNKWIANLRQNYFQTPWASISVVAAVILLILTIMQTICSFFQVK